MAKSGNNKKKNQLPLLIGAVALAAAAVAAVTIGGGGVPSAGGGVPSAGGTQVIEAGGNLVIPVAEVTETAAFYPIEVDGTEMEVLAIRDLSGNIRTAFNTCQSCYTSGHGYYVADGTDLVCQNCGFRFTAEEVEVPGGGCNPYPIFPENKTVTDSEIQVSYDFLKASSAIFDNWSKE